MPIPVKFVLSRRDLVPPVYLAGSFTQWQPNLLMDSHAQTDETGSWNEFRKVVELEPGVYQYKFRLGDGDWWITDEAHEKITDASGNVNNTISVEEPGKTQPEESQLEAKPISTAVKEEDANDKPSLRWSTRSKATSDNTTSSSNITVVETSSLLKNRSSVTRNQAGMYESISGQNHERSESEQNPALQETNSSKSAKLPNGADAKPKPKSGSYFRRLLCFCSTHTGLSIAGFGTVLVAAYMIHAQVH